MFGTHPDWFDRFFSLEIQDKHLNTWFLFASQVVKLGCPSVVLALLQARADPNARDPIGGLTVSHDAAREGFLDTLRALAQNGADVNLLDNDGNLPLHLAAREGHLDVVEYLVSQCNTQPFQPNAKGYTPRDLAFMHKQHRTVEWLEGIVPS